MALFPPTVAELIRFNTSVYGTVVDGIEDAAEAIVARAVRAVDACGGTYTAAEEASGYADGHRAALDAATAAVQAMHRPGERLRTGAALFEALEMPE